MTLKSQDHKILKDTKPEVWRKELKEDICVNDWKEMCKEAQTQTVNVRLKLLQYKWLMQTYITPTTLHKYNRNILDTCGKCPHLKYSVPLHLGLRTYNIILEGCEAHDR